MNGYREPEIVVLACLINGWREAGKHWDMVKPEYFGEKGKRVYNAIAKVLRTGADPDLLTVAFAEPDLRMDIIDICKDHVTGANFIYNLIILSEIQARKISQSEMARLVKLLENDCDIFDFIEAVDDYRMKVESTLVKLKKTDSFDAVVDQALLYRKNSPTGIPSIDHHISNIGKSSYVVIGARPSVGKSIYALQVAINRTRAGQKVIFFTFEMNRVEIVRRMLSHYSGIPMDQFFDGVKLREDVYKTIEKIKTNPIRMDDGGDGTNTVEYIKRIVKREQPDLIIVDYTQYMDDHSGRTIREKINNISRGLKMIAKYYDVEVHALAQLNRDTEGEKRQPRISDLKESGNLEQDADCVMLLHPPESIHQCPPVTGLEVIIGKNRNGKTGVVTVTIDRALSRLYDTLPSYCQPGATVRPVVNYMPSDLPKDEVLPF